jgi:hypothetical protein
MALLTTHFRQLALNCGRDFEESVAVVLSSDLLTTTTAVCELAEKHENETVRSLQLEAGSLALYAETVSLLNSDTSRRAELMSKFLDLSAKCSATKPQLAALDAFLAEIASNPTAAASMLKVSSSEVFLRNLLTVWTAQTTGELLSSTSPTQRVPQPSVKGAVHQLWAVMTTAAVTRDQSFSVSLQQLFALVEEPIGRIVDAAVAATAHGVLATESSLKDSIIGDLLAKLIGFTALVMQERSGFTVFVKEALPMIAKLQQGRLRDLVGLVETKRGNSAGSYSWLRDVDTGLGKIVSDLAFKCLDSPAWDTETEGSSSGVLDGELLTGGRIAKLEPSSRPVSPLDAVTTEMRFLSELIELQPGSGAATFARTMKRHVQSDRGLQSRDKAMRATAACFLWFNGGRETVREARAVAEQDERPSSKLVEIWRSAQQMREWFDYGDVLQAMTVQNLADHGMKVLHPAPNEPLIPPTRNTHTHAHNPALTQALSHVYAHFARYP